jgi:hypothetical protein
VIVVPFEPHHLCAFDPIEGAVLSIVTVQHLARLRTLGPAVTAFDGDQIIGCAGVIVQEGGCGTLWAFCAVAARTRIIRMHRGLERLISIVPLRRLEASARVDFAPACRWLELLKFEREGIMRKFGPDGSDHVRYART